MSNNTLVGTRRASIEPQTRADRTPPGHGVYRSARRRTAVVAVFYTLLYLIYFSPALISGRLLAPGDGVAYSLPVYLSPKSSLDPPALLRLSPPGRPAGDGLLSRGAPAGVVSQLVEFVRPQRLHPRQRLDLLPGPRPDSLRFRRLNRRHALWHERVLHGPPRAHQHDPLRRLAAADPPGRRQTPHALLPRLAGGRRLRRGDVDPRRPSADRRLRTGTDRRLCAVAGMVCPGRPLALWIGPGCNGPAGRGAVRGATAPGAGIGQAKPARGDGLPQPHPSQRSPASAHDAAVPLSPRRGLGQHLPFALCWRVQYSRGLRLRWTAPADAGDDRGPAPPRRGGGVVLGDCRDCRLDAGHRRRHALGPSHASASRIPLFPRPVPSSTGVHAGDEYPGGVWCGPSPGLPGPPPA